MKKRYYMYLLALMALSVFVFGDVSSLLAKGSDTGEFTLEEITVTAQKRAENQQKVAIAMETITGDEMAELGKTDINEILSNTSNVIINSSIDGMRVTLRGVADDVAVNATDQHVSTPTVAVNVDGAYNNRSTAGQTMYDVERVEVLFGPQSTMYASNSPGGIVNVITASPKTDKFSASGSLEYGNYNKMRAEGAVNVPISSIFALRTAVNLTKRNSYIIGSKSGDENTKAARLKVLFQPNDKLSAVLTGQYSTRSDNGMAVVVPFGNQDDVSNPWTLNNVYSKRVNDEKSRGVSALISWDTGIGSLAITPSYLKSTAAGTSFKEVGGAVKTVYNSDNTMSNIQKGAEARMVSSADFIFKWILGANYYESTDERNSLLTPRVLPGANQESKGIHELKSHAFFGNITYPVTNKFRATAGYRRSWDKMSHFEHDSMRPAGPGAPSEWVFADYSSPDTKLGVEYDLSDSSMFYMDRSTSYRMQGSTTTNAKGESAPPERLTAYTVGAKNRFLNNKLQLNAAAFYYNYKNKVALQSKMLNVFENEVYVNGVNTPVDLNRNGVKGEPGVLGGLRDPNSQGWADFRTYGADIQANLLITNEDKLNLSVSYLNSKWLNLIFDYYYDNFPDENFSGMQNTYSPTWTINSSYDHMFNLGNGGTLTARADGQYQSSFILSWTSAERPFNYQEPHYILNSSVVYAPPNGSWTVSAYVKNIFDYALKTSYVARGKDGNLMIGEPRTFGAVLTAKF